MIKIGFTKQSEKQSQKKDSADTKKKGVLETLKEHAKVLKDD